MSIGVDLHSEHSAMGDFGSFLLVSLKPTVWFQHIALESAEP